METIKKWLRLILSSGKKSSLFLLILFIAFSGIGYLFVNQFNDVRYFDKIVNFNKHVIQTFYDGDSGKYLVQIGKESEADKISIEIGSKHIKEFIQQMPQFQKSGKFNKETYDGFIKNHEISQYDVWVYAAQQLKIRVLERMIYGLPGSFFPEIERALVSSKTINSVQGFQYIVKDEMVDEAVQQLMKQKNKGDLATFIKEKTKELSFFFVNPETRKGFLIELTDQEAKNFSTDDLNWVIRQRTSDLKDIQKLQQHFKGHNIKIVQIEYSPKSPKLSGLLFDSTDFYERGGSVFIPIVEEIKPIHAKDFTEEEVKQLEKEYEHMLFSKCAVLCALELANNFNNGLLSEKDLEKMCFKKTFSKNIDRLLTSDLKFFATGKNKAVIFQNYEGKASIFIEKTKTFKPSNNQTLTLLKQNGIDITAQMIQINFDGFFAYWIRKFENQ